MPEQWVTIAAAAAAINVHPRTIERRVASGKIQSRRTDDGTQQVFVAMPDATPPGIDPLTTVRELAQDQVSLATGSASAIVRLAQADAERMRDELTIVRDESNRLRQGARIAWTTVALLGLAACVAVGFTTHEMTWSRSELRSLHDRLGDSEQRSIDASAELKQTQRDLEIARTSAAESNGQLTAYIEQAKMRSGSPDLTQNVSGARPATQPANSLIGRIASLFSGD